jgi:hypothetical protein
LTLIRCGAELPDEHSNMLDAPWRRTDARAGYHGRPIG